MHSDHASDDWARRASCLPLAFAQVREDPRLDVRLVSALPNNPVVVMIASGGETAVQVARCRPTHLHLVDINPAQLAMTRLKLSLSEHSSVAEARAVLGHDVLEPSTRRAILTRLLGELGLPENTFGSMVNIAEWGLDFSGRYEQTFAELQRELLPIRPEISSLLNSSDLPVAAAGLLDSRTESGRAFDRAFNKVMSLKNLVCLFGADATQNPRQSFAEHFAWRTRLCLSRSDRKQNPFLWQLLLGRFPSLAAYDWLQPDAFESSKAKSQPNLHCGRMIDVLATFPDASVDLVHLSNILDWLSPDDASKTLQCAHRVLKSGGLVILRQLNSTLSVPDLESHLRWDDAIGKRMVEEDRSFFYPQIFVGVHE